MENEVDLARRATSLAPPSPSTRLRFPETKTAEGSPPPTARRETFSIEPVVGHDLATGREDGHLLAKFPELIFGSQVFLTLITELFSYRDLTL